MRDQASFGPVAAVLAGASHVVIGAHVDPDGDAIGSALGLGHALESIGVTVTFVLASGTACPATYAFLPGAERFVLPADVTGSPDVFVALDTPDPLRLGLARELALSARHLVVIDHHPDASTYGHTHLLNATAAATGALVWQLLPHLGATPGPDVATCLYAALLTDTGRFCYSNTTSETLRTAAEMVDAGASPHEIYTSLYEDRSPGAQQLVGRALARVTLANAGHVAYSWVEGADFAETGALPEEAENLIDFVRALGGVDVVFLAKVNGTTVRGSLRAKTGFDVGSVARALGGGGHHAAAGFTFEGGLEDTLAALLPLLPGSQL